MGIVVWRTHFQFGIYRGSQGSASPESLLFLLTKEWLISLNTSLKFYWRYWDFFFSLHGILEPKGCGKTTSHSHPMSATQSIRLLLCRALFYCCKICRKLQSLILFLFPLKLSLPFLSESILIYSGLEKERFEEQVLIASKSIIFLGKTVNSIPRLSDKIDTTGEAP